MLAAGASSFHHVFLYVQRTDNHGLQGKSQECKACNNTVKAHERRHREIAENLFALKVVQAEENDIVDTPRKNSILQPIGNREKHTLGITPTRKKDKKAEKKMLKAAGRDKVVTGEDVERVARVLHSEMDDDNKKSDDSVIQANLSVFMPDANNRVRRASIKAANVLNVSDEVSDAELADLLAELGVSQPVDKPLKKIPDTIDKIAKLVKEDIIVQRREERDYMMRKGGYWRYANKKTYNAMVAQQEIVDWETGAKLTVVEEEMNDELEDTPAAATPPIEVPSTPQVAIAVTGKVGKTKMPLTTVKLSSNGANMSVFRDWKPDPNRQRLQVPVTPFVKGTYTNSNRYDFFGFHEEDFEVDSDDSDVGAPSEHLRTEDQTISACASATVSRRESTVSSASFSSRSSSNAPSSTTFYSARSEPGTVEEIPEPTGPDTHTTPKKEHGFGQKGKLPTTLESSTEDGTRPTKHDAIATLKNKIISNGRVKSLLPSMPTLNPAATSQETILHSGSHVNKAGETETAQKKTTSNQMGRSMPSGESSGPTLEPTANKASAAASKAKGSQITPAEAKARRAKAKRDRQKRNKEAYAEQVTAAKEDGTLACYCMWEEEVLLVRILVQFENRLVVARCAPPCCRNRTLDRDDNDPPSDIPNVKETMFMVYSAAMDEYKPWNSDAHLNCSPSWTAVKIALDRNPYIPTLYGPIWGCGHNKIKNRAGAVVYRQLFRKDEELFFAEIMSTTGPLTESHFDRIAACSKKAAFLVYKGKPVAYYTDAVNEGLSALSGDKTNQSRSVVGVWRLDKELHRPLFRLGDSVELPEHGGIDVALTMRSHGDAFEYRPRFLTGISPLKECLAEIPLENFAFITKVELDSTSLYHATTVVAQGIKNVHNGVLHSDHIKKWLGKWLEEKLNYGQAKEVSKDGTQEAVKEHTKETATDKAKDSAAEVVKKWAKEAAEDVD